MAELTKLYFNNKRITINGGTRQDYLDLDAKVQGQDKGVWIISDSWLKSIYDNRPKPYQKKVFN